MNNPIVDRVRKQKLIIEGLLKETGPVMESNGRVPEPQDQSKSLHPELENDWSDFHNWSNWENNID